MGMEGWQKVLLAAGGAAAAGALLWYVLKDDSEEKASTAGGGSDGKKVPVEDITREHVLEILQEIIKSQDQMRGYMKDLTKELVAKKLSFRETYARVKELQPEDPLEKHGLSMMEFDQLLDKNQNYPAVRESIAKIMGAPSPQTPGAERPVTINVKKIIEVHAFMLEELKKLATDFENMSDRASFDTKTVTIAAQALVGAQVEQKFDVSSDDIEQAVLMHHAELATDQQFANINIAMQSTMGQLMGGPFPTA